MISIALRALRAAGLLGLLAAQAALAQEAAATRRATELREAAGDAARVLAPLPAQTAVTRTGERQGAWVQVRTATGQSGWVHLFDLGPATGGGSAEAASGGANPLRGVTGLFGSNRPATTATAASGIRGLGAEDLAQAQPNPQAVQQMEQLRQSEADARSFAESAALQPVGVEPLPVPARAAAGGGGGDPSRPQ